MASAKVWTYETLKALTAPGGPRGECWVWQRPLRADGYGQLRFHGKTVCAHRAMWIVLFGDPGWLGVLHECDNRACIFPGHLWLGDDRDNMRDMFRKGRARPGGRRVLSLAPAYSRAV